MKNVSHIEAPSSETSSATREVIQTAKERAVHVKGTVAEEANRAMDSIKSAAAESVERGKHELAGSLKSVDEALRKTSSEMQNSALAPQVERVADALAQAHQFIEQHSIEDLGAAVRRLSLQYPVVFYAGIFAAGFAAGRFLSSTENRSFDQAEINLHDEDISDNQPMPGQMVSHHGSYEARHSQPDREDGWRAV
jgi:hypothetical protein